MYIKLNNIFKRYANQTVLKDVTLNVASEELVVIRGASGSGKSTLLYLLSGLEIPSSGQIEVGGKNLATLNDSTLAHYRNQEVGIIFQHHFLLPALSCERNILLPFDLRAKKGSLEKEVQEMKNLAKYLGVTHCLKKFPPQLSGGEQQRVNILRAILKRPRLLLCDEPTGNLDSSNAQKVMEILLDLTRNFAMTLLVVTHDTQIAKSFPREILLRDGVVL